MRKGRRKNLLLQHWYPIGVSETIRIFACGSGSWIAMRAGLWLIFCALGVAGICNATAASVSAQDQDNASHAAAENNNPHDGGNTNTSGDALGLNRDGSPHSTNNDNSSSVRQQQQRPLFRGRGSRADAYPSAAAWLAVTVAWIHPVDNRRSA
jgi:hypothetical protein